MKIILFTVGNEVKGKKRSKIGVKIELNYGNKYSQKYLAQSHILPVALKVVYHSFWLTELEP